MSSSLNTINLSTFLESGTLDSDNPVLTLFDLDRLNLDTESLFSDDSFAQTVRSLYRETGSLDELLSSVDKFVDAQTGNTNSIQTLVDTVSHLNTSGAASFNFADNLLASTSTKAVPAAAIYPFAKSIFSNTAFSNPGTLKTLLSDTVAPYFSSIPPEAAAFTTVAPDGQRIYNGKGNAQALKWSSSNGKSDGRNATSVTFAFKNDFAVNSLSLDKAKSLIVSALDTWAKYAPLDFQEIEDPGANDKVDIRVQSAAIDGAGKTLAYAYFPTVGDITFDTAESWSETKFLETAVHELGHSLGLDHDNDTTAIMNSVLGNQFAGKSEPFLLEDDIQGIRNLYGTGKGSVATLGPKSNQNSVAVPIETSPDSINNLVANGSFEDTPVEADSFGVYNRIKGWSKISGAGFQVDRRTQVAGKAADGTAWVELDVYGQNGTIGQNIDTLTGEDYTLSVDFTSGGRDAESTAIDVFWEGQRIDTLTGGGQGNWKTYQYGVKGSDRTVSTLAFRAVGKSDNMGGFIDNVVLQSRTNVIEAESYALGLSQQSGLAGNGLTITDFAPNLILSEQPINSFPETAAWV